MIFVGSAGARYVALGFSSRVPESSTISAPARRPHSGRPSASTRTRRALTSRCPRRGRPMKPAGAAAVGGDTAELPGVEDERLAGRRVEVGDAPDHDVVISGGDQLVHVAGELGERMAHDEEAVGRSADVDARGRRRRGCAKSRAIGAARGAACSTREAAGAADGARAFASRARARRGRGAGRATRT